MYTTEVSVYASDSLKAIQDVVQLKLEGNREAAKRVEVLRVMHCSQLTEMRGLHLFPNVSDLNVSSNSILTMSGLESLNRLESLNMSCNKLTRIFCLANIAKTLKHLNLSHNRIVSLLPLEEFADISALEVLDLTDNYIGDLSHLKALAKYGKLRDLSFRKAGDESKGSNPICDFVNYQDSVKLYLPNLAILDGLNLKKQQLSPSKSAPMAGTGSNLGSRHDPSRGIYSANPLEDSPTQMVTGK